MIFMEYVECAMSHRTANTRQATVKLSCALYDSTRQISVTNPCEGVKGTVKISCARSVLLGEDQLNHVASSWEFKTSICLHLKQSQADTIPLLIKTAYHALDLMIKTQCCKQIWFNFDPRGIPCLACNGIWINTSKNHLPLDWGDKSRGGWRGSICFGMGFRPCIRFCVSVEIVALFILLTQTMGEKGHHFGFEIGSGTCDQSEQQWSSHWFRY